MRIALYIEEGLEQVVLTPETDTERSLLSKINEREIQIKHGSFYQTIGGWVREGRDENSTMLVLRDDKEVKPDLENALRGCAKILEDVYPPHTIGMELKQNLTQILIDNDIDPSSGSLESWRIVASWLLLRMRAARTVAQEAMAS